MSQTDRRHSHKQYYSLKWKALLLLGLLLLGLNAIFPYLNYKSLDTHLQKQQEDELIKSLAILDSLIRKSATNLQQSAGLTAFVSELGQTVAQQNGENLYQKLDPYWPYLQFDLGIDNAIFFDNQGNALSQWGDIETNAAKVLSPFVKNAVELESPSATIYCQLVCKQYAMVPLLAQQRVSGILMLSKPLTDVIIEHKNLTKHDIGIITKPEQEAGPTLGTVDSLPYNSRLMALTEKAKNLPLVAAALNRLPALSSSHEDIALAVENNHYRIQFQPLHQAIPLNSSYVVLIRDITEKVNEISQGLRNSWIAAVCGLLVSAGFLVAFLWGPMQRLQSVSQALPSLAERRHKQGGILDTLPPPSKTAFPDEIDQLIESSHILRDKLSLLEKRVNDRTLRLSEKIQELAKEKEFVQLLFDTAQVIILTHDAEGKIFQSNHHARHLAGITSKSGSLLINRFIADDRLAEIRQWLKQNKGGNQFRQESSLVSTNGNIRNITWLHSKLEKKQYNEAQILSVGLDITELKQAEVRFAWLADHDPLTGMYNRRRLGEELTNILNISKRHNHNGALLFIDLDQFKYINDTSGHQTGDALLVEVASRLRHLLRSTDVMARLGGDEFAIVLPEIDEKGATLVANKINLELDKIIVPLGDRRIKMTSSIGIALFPQHGLTPSELIAKADIAMYHAKESGRGRAHTFSETNATWQKMQNHMQWKSKLEEAINSDKFVLLFQPILDIQEGTVRHYEVLLRLREGDGTLLRPQQFITFAEKNGLIRQIDHLVLRKAILTLAKAFPEHENLSFSINLSAYAFDDPDLLPLLQKTLSETKLNPQSLIFELTETSAIADFVASKQLMSNIKNMGCRLALDDFGVGFSSFKYVKELPFDFIKIDGSFIKNLTTSKDDQVLVQALCNVARSFNKLTVAEFVEDEETLELLKKYNIDYAQGFHVGTPSAELKEAQGTH